MRNFNTLFYKPLTAGGEDMVGGNGSSLFLGDLATPRCATALVGTGTAVVVFQIASGLLVGGVAPVVPTLWADVDI